MGITGTEVSKGAAVMILTDDNFATIVKAVEFGRAIYNNLFNFVRFQMAQLVAFIASYLLAAFFVVLGGVPFTPFFVLWVNFLATVPLAIALAFDKPASDLMEHKPRPLSQPILSPSQWVRVILLGLLTAIVTVTLERTYEASGTAVAATMGFVAFALLSVAMGLSARSETGTAFNRDILQRSKPADPLWDGTAVHLPADGAGLPTAPPGNDLPERQPMADLHRLCHCPAAGR